MEQHRCLFEIKKKNPKEIMLGEGNSWSIRFLIKSTSKGDVPSFTECVLCYFNNCQ